MECKKNVNRIFENFKLRLPRLQIKFQLTWDKI